MVTDKTIEPNDKKHIAYHGALLGFFTFLATSLLVMGNISTKKNIEQRIAEDLQASLSQVIPASIHDNKLINNRIIIQHNHKDVIVYQAIKTLKNKSQETTAVAFSVIGNGYAGDIHLIMGVNKNAQLLGVRVLSHAETPGLGDRIEAKKDNWIFSFNGLSFSKLNQDKWKVKKDGGVFDQFSGATITPRAVVAAIKQGLIMFNQHQQQLLSINNAAEDKKTKHATGENNDS